MASLGTIRDLSRFNRSAGTRSTDGIRGAELRWRSRSARWLILAVVAPLAAVACSGGDVPAAPTDDPELVLGQSVYATNCIQCHGPQGGGGVGPRLSGGALLEEVPDPAEQRDIVVNGRGRMPAFGEKLSDAEVEAVVSYTREVIAAP